MGNRGDRNSLRGKSYDKYMEKRVMKLRMEQGSKRAAMNQAKLRSLRDDLKRCKIELQGMVVSSRDGELGSRRQLHKFNSINVRSNQMTEEQRFDIFQHEVADDLTRYLGLREKMISRASAEDELLPISRRKDSPVRSRPSSSLAQPIVLPVPQSSKKLKSSISPKPRNKPENLLQYRKENAKPPPAISRKANYSIASSSVQTRNISEDLQKSWSSLKTRSASPLGYENSSEREYVKGKIMEQEKGYRSIDESYWMSFNPEYLTNKAKQRTFSFEPSKNKSHCNPSFHTDNVENKAKVNLLAMRLDDEESHRDLLKNFSSSVDLDSGKRMSFKLEKEQDFGNFSLGMDSSGYTAKTSSYVMRNVEDIGVRHSTVATEGTKDSAAEKAHDDRFGVNVKNRRSRQQSVDSGIFESTNDNSSRSLSCVELSMNSASELLNSTLVENLEVFCTESLNGTPTTCEMAPVTGVVKSHESDTNRIRRKIRNLPKSFPPATNCSYRRSQMRIWKGFEPFPIFCKMSPGNECSANWASTTTSEGDQEFFKKNLLLEEQGPSTPLEGIKQKGRYLSGRSLTATRSILSLSSLRCRRDDTKSQTTDSH